nr:hypothetical protein [Tanacetum cinerariifolium]
MGVSFADYRGTYAFCCLVFFFTADDSSGRSPRFSVVGFGSADVAVLVSVSDFLAGMVETIQKRETMEWLPMCAKLEEAVGARNWLDMVTLYYRKFASKHREFAIKLNRLRGEMIEACQDRIAFVWELESVAGVTVMAKTTVFLKEMIDKERSREWRLQDLGKEAKERALEIELFVQKLMHKLPVCYDDDDDEERSISLKDNIISGLPLCAAITPSLSTEEPDNSLSMGDEHLDTVPTTESDEFIKSSEESLVPIPSESEGVLENMCDVPFHDNSPPLDVSKDQFEDFPDSNDEFTSTDDDSFSIDNIEYVEASPLDSELVISKVTNIVILKVGGIDDDILLTIKDHILREKMLNINLLIANIEALNDNPTPSFDFMTKSSSTSLNSLLEETSTFDNSLPELETFCFDLEEIISSSTTTRSDISLPEYEAFYDDHVKEISSEYDCFFFKIKPKSGGFTMDVVEDISPTREPRVHVHNALPTHPTLQLNLEFILSSESLFTYVVWIFLPFSSYSVAP